MDSVNWPIYGIIKNPSVRDNPYFKIQSRNLYVDVPNEVIITFITELGRKASETEDDINKMYEEFKNYAKEVNQQLKREKIPWLQFIIRREVFGKRPIGIQFRIKWDQFFEFIENFSVDDKISLSDKYEYLFLCKRSGLVIALKDKESRIENTQKKKVMEIVKGDIFDIEKRLDRFCDYLNVYKDRLLKKARRRNLSFLTLEYFPEMISTLLSMKNMVSNGVVAPCYREMRKILENLSWAVFNDVLYLRSVNLRVRDVEFIPTLYVGISREWYTKSQEKKHVLKNISDLYGYIDEFSDKIHFYGRIGGYNWGKRAIREVVFANLDYSLIIALTGKERENYGKNIVSVKVGDLKKLLSKSLENILFKLKGRKLNNLDKKFVTELTQEILGDKKDIVPAFPSNSLVIQFVSKTIKSDLTKLYGNYSFFVHSYPSSWQMFPYSSVLEYKILKHEVQKFESKIKHVVNSVPELSPLA